MERKIKQIKLDILEFIFLSSQFFASVLQQQQQQWEKNNKNYKMLPDLCDY